MQTGRTLADLLGPDSGGQGGISRVLWIPLRAARAVCLFDSSAGRAAASYLYRFTPPATVLVRADDRRERWPSVSRPPPLQYRVLSCTPADLWPGSCVLIPVLTNVELVRTFLSRAMFSPLCIDASRECDL